MSIKHNERKHKMSDRKQKTIEMEKTIKTWTAEMSPGKFLHMNATEDGNGTWFDTTENLFDAYWNDHDQIEDICLTEFSQFGAGFPILREVEFSYKILKEEKPCL